METVTFDFTDRTNYGLTNPMHTSSLTTKQFEKEEEGRFRDTLMGLEAEAVYSEKDIRSEFIESLRIG